MISKISSCYKLFPSETILNSFASGNRLDRRAFTERRSVVLEEVHDDDMQFSVSLENTKLNCHLQIKYKENHINQSKNSNSNVLLKMFLNDNSPCCMDSEFSIGHKATILSPLRSKETIFNFFNKEMPSIFKGASLNKTETQKAYDNLIKESGINETVFTLNKDEDSEKNRFIAIKFHFDIVENDGNLEKALFYGIKEMLLSDKMNKELAVYLNNWNTGYLNELEMEKVSLIEEYVIMDPSRKEEGAANNHMWLFFSDNDKVKVKIENMLTLNELNIEDTIKKVKTEIFK